MKNTEYPEGWEKPYPAACYAVLSCNKDHKHSDKVRLFAGFTNWRAEYTCPTSHQATLHASGDTSHEALINLATELRRYSNSLVHLRMDIMDTVPQPEVDLGTAPGPGHGIIA